MSSHVKIKTKQGWSKLHYGGNRATCVVHKTNLWSTYEVLGGNLVSAGSVLVTPGLGGQAVDGFNDNRMWKQFADCVFLLR